MGYKNFLVFVGVLVVSAVMVLLISDSSFYSIFFRSLVGLFIFYSMDKLFKINFKKRHYFYMAVIIFLGVGLSSWYFHFEYYDKVLHFLMPILGGALVFFIVDRVKIKFQWKLLITFLAVLSFLALLEVYEYILDVYFNWRLQGVFLIDSSIKEYDIIQEGLDDTMLDLIFGLFGILVFVVGKAIGFVLRKKSDWK